MNFYIHLLIFIVILFFYIHIVHQYKRSEDLEIYEMDYVSNAHLQEVCDVKQPILFEYRNVVPEFYETVTYDDLLDPQYAGYDIRVKEATDYFESDASVDYVVLPYSSGSNLMKTDSKAAYFSENNEDFLEESGLIKGLGSVDDDLKPTFVVQSKYDIMLGSRGVSLPLRYHTHYRHFLSVNSGKIRVKMTPWKSTKYLYQIRDFETYEFRSPVNVWSSTTNSGGVLKSDKKYRHEMDKIRFLEFEVNPGFVLSIPPYWWYSIQYDDKVDTLVCGFTYNSLMNTVANVPYFVKYYIQQSNIQKRVAKVLDYSEKQEISNPSTEDVPSSDVDASSLNP
jgi:hypothetical protein